MSNIVGNYLTYYYTEFMLVDATLVSSILSIGILVDGISDYIMGAVVDRVRIKHGKVKHWFLWVSIPAAFSSMLIFLCPQGWSATAKLVYLFVVYNVYCTCLTTIRLPASSMLAVGFKDHAVRRQAGVVSGLATQLRSAITSTTIAPLLAVMGGGIIAYRTTSILYGAIGGLLALCTYFTLTEVIGSRGAAENVRKIEGEAAAEEALAILDAEEHNKESKKKKKRNLFLETSQLFRNKFWVIHQLTPSVTLLPSAFYWAQRFISAAMWLAT